MSGSFTASSPECEWVWPRPGVAQRAEWQVQGDRWVCTWLSISPVSNLLVKSFCSLSAAANRTFTSCSPRAQLDRQKDRRQDKCKGLKKNVIKSHEVRGYGTEQCLKHSVPRERKDMHGE